MPNYKDTALNRRMGRVGKPYGSSPVTKAKLKARPAKNYRKKGGADEKMPKEEKKADAAYGKTKKKPTTFRVMKNLNYGGKIKRMEVKKIVRNKITGKVTEHRGDSVKADDGMYRPAKLKNIQAKRRIGTVIANRQKYNQQKKDFENAFRYGKGSFDPDDSYRFMPFHEFQKIGYDARE